MWYAVEMEYNYSLRSKLSSLAADVGISQKKKESRQKETENGDLGRGSRGGYR